MSLIALIQLLHKDMLFVCELDDREDVAVMVMEVLPTCGLYEIGYIPTVLAATHLARDRLTSGSFADVP